MKLTQNNHIYRQFPLTTNSGSLPKGLLLRAFSRFKTDQNSKEDGSLQLRLCFQDVTQALYLASWRYNNLLCARFVSFVDKELPFLSATFLWLEPCSQGIDSNWKRVIAAF